MFPFGHASNREHTHFFKRVMSRLPAIPFHERFRQALRSGIKYLFAKLPIYITDL
jgi:hypothetical protein